VEDLAVRLDPLGRVTLELPDVPERHDVPVGVVAVRLAAPGIEQPRLPAVDQVVRQARLTVAGLEAGRWCLVLRVRGAAPTRTEPFEVLAGRETRLGPVRLAAPRHLQGMVRDPEGRPVAATVALCSPFLRPLAERRSVFLLGDRCVTSTDAGGDFRFDDLAAGPQTLAIRARGFQELVLRDVEVTAPAGLDLGAVVLAPGATLVVRLADAAGAAVAGRTVELTGTGRSERGVSDVRGRCAFADLAPGTYTLAVPADRDPEQALADALQGGAATRQRVEARAGETREVHLTVAR